MRHRLTISIAPELHAEIRAAVRTGSMSAWFAEAARRRLLDDAGAGLRQAAALVDPDEDVDDIAGLVASERGRGDLPWSSLRAASAEE